jgi:hypothetical protein
MFSLLSPEEGNFLEASSSKLQHADELPSET